MMALGALLGASAGMSAISGLSQYNQGQYASEVARRQAEAEEQQSQYVQQNAGQQIIQSDYKAAHLLSRSLVENASSGVAQEGSPAINFSSSAEEARINDMYIKYAANVQSKQLLDQAELTKIAGKQEASAATIGGLTTAIGGPISSGITAYGLGSRSGSLPFGMNNYSDQLMLTSFR